MAPGGGTSVRRFVFVGSVFTKENTESTEERKPRATADFVEDADETA
jgi:hypothetical protein